MDRWRPISEATAADRRARLLTDGKAIAITPRVDSRYCGVDFVADTLSMSFYPDRLADQKSDLSACGIGSRF